MAWSTPANVNTGDLITAAVWNQNVVANPTALLPIALAFWIDGGGAAITTGVKGWIESPAKCTIARGSQLPDVSGTIVTDIWKCTYANYDRPGTAHPVDADSITAAAPLTCTATTKSQDSTLTGWTTAVAAGDILAFNVDSCATITKCLVSLVANRS